MQSRAGLALLRTSGAGDLLLASRLHALQQAAPLRFVQTALERPRSKLQVVDEATGRKGVAETALAAAPRHSRA